MAGGLRHGLGQPRVVPARAQRELRARTRYRKSRGDERRADRAAVNRFRLQKTLEGAHSKRAGVASDVVGAAGRAMLERLRVGAGQTAPARLAQGARGTRRRTIPALARARAGSVGPPQRFRVARQVAHIAYRDSPTAIRLPR
jgi:hypothetical protein